jgi:hypothetical protein
VFHLHKLLLATLRGWPSIPRPSYSSVRRIVIAERRRKRENAELLDVLLADLFTGRFPTRFVEHKVGVGGWRTLGSSGS